MTSRGWCPGQGAGPPYLQLKTKLVHLRQFMPAVLGVQSALQDCLRFFSFTSSTPATA